MLKLCTFVAILLINVSLSLSSPETRVRRADGQSKSSPSGSSSESTSLKVKSGVENQSTAETSLAEINLPFKFGIGLDNQFKLANGVLSGGVGAGPLNKVFDLPAVLAGLAAGIMSAQKNLPSLPQLPQLPQVQLPQVPQVQLPQVPKSPQTVIIDEVLTEIEKSNAPASNPPPNPLGVNLAEFPKELTELAALIGNLLTAPPTPQQQ